MKKFTKVVSLLAASALLVLLPNANALTASADTPNTFTIFYVEEEGEWCYLDNSSKDEDDYEDDIEDFYDEVQNGDNVVIFGYEGQKETFEIPAYLNSLTVMSCGSSYLIIYTNGVSEVQAGNDAFFSVTGDVQNAYVHNDAKVTFHGHVNMLTIETDDRADVSCISTVAHALCINGGNVEFDIYNVAADKLRVDNAELETEEQYYSTTPVAPAATPAPQTSNSTTASNDYDDVPKTGDSYIVYVLLAAAAICFAGSRAFKKA